MAGFFDSLFGGGDEDRVLRDPEFAGIQYPDEAGELREVVDGCLADGESVGSGASAGDLRGIAVPYGDYRYAGPIMGAAYAAVASAEVERVVVLGPSERVPFRGLAVAGYDAWSTPLGELAVDLSRVEGVVERDDVRPIDVAFEPAAALELQVPFLQRVNGETPFAPLLVGDTDGETVGSVLEQLWDEGTLLVVASNLSRGLSESEADEQDRQTLASLTALDAEAIGREGTSNRMALRGMIQVAERRGWSIDEIDSRTSAETAGEPDKVVGYGALAVTR